MSEQQCTNNTKEVLNKIAESTSEMSDINQARLIDVRGLIVLKSWGRNVLQHQSLESSREMPDINQDRLILMSGVDCLELSGRNVMSDSINPWEFSCKRSGAYLHNCEDICTWELVTRKRCFVKHNQQHCNKSFQPQIRMCSSKEQHTYSHRKKNPFAENKTWGTDSPFSLSFVLKLQLADGGEVFPCSPVLPFFNPQLKTLNYNSSDSRDTIQTWKKTLSVKIQQKSAPAERLTQEQSHLQ